MKLIKYFCLVLIVDTLAYVLLNLMLNKNDKLTELEEDVYTDDEIAEVLDFL